jgi:DNA-binding CsgD family transcriptional regulator
MKMTQPKVLGRRTVPFFDIDLQSLLSRIYDTGSGDWKPLLDDMRQFLGGDAAALILHDFRHNLGSILFATGYNQKYLHSPASTDARHNVWLARERDYRLPGTIHLGEQLVPEHELVRTKFYTEWLAPQGLHHRLCAVLSRDDATAVFLEVMRSREADAFDDDDIERCRLLLPHLQRALRMYRRMAALEVQRDVAFRTLDQLPWGVMLVDKQRKRLATNRHAEELLIAGDGLTARGNTLRAELADETARLERLLSDALDRSGREGVSGTLSITRASGAPLNVVVVPLHIKPEKFAEQGPIAAIFVTDPDMPFHSSQYRQQLRELYALTPGEARLATWLVQGKSVEEAAAAMGVTINTARGYLKRIYQKTGVRRQPELMRLLLLGLPRLREDRPQTPQ